MNTYFSSRIRNIIFLVFLTLTILITIIACLAASSQDKIFLADYNQYLIASQLLNQNKYAEAEPVIANLAIKNNDTYQILWMYGQCLSGSGKPAAGLEYLQKARDIRPALLMNQSFLVQYGEILYDTGDYTGAERYLKESRKYNKGSNYDKKAEKLLEQIKILKN